MGGALSVNFEVAPINVSLEYDDIGSDGTRGGRILSNPLRPEHARIINCPNLAYRRIAEGDGDGAHSIKVEVTPMNVSLEYDGIGSDGKRGGRILSNPLRPEHAPR